MRGIKINGIHTGRAWRLIMHSFAVEDAEVKETLVDVPASNGALDYTECFGEVYYKPRKLTAEFEAVRSHDDFIKLRDELVNRYHGRQVEIVTDDNTDFYYIGRARLGGFWAVERGCGVLQLTVTCRPYKLKIQETSVEQTIGAATANLCPPFVLWEVSDSLIEVHSRDTCAVLDTAEIKSPYIPLNTAGTYTVKFSRCCRFYAETYSADKRLKNKYHSAGRSAVFTVGADEKFIRVVLAPTEVDRYPAVYSEPHVFVGNNKKSYVPYNDGTLIFCENLRMPSVPEIDCECSVTLQMGDKSVTLPQGKFFVPDFELKQGCNVIKLSGGTVGKTVGIKYQEGEL